jgi:Uma2 family endonuclease
MSLLRGNTEAQQGATMTAITSRSRPAQPIAPLPTTEEQHLVLSEIDWHSYIAVGHALADRGGLRITYDRGNLEFMTTSRLHERYKKWLNRFIETIAEELHRPLGPGGNMTFQRQDLARGLEGAECFWMEREAHMRTKDSWDPETDPPPDLFLEIDVSRSLLDRLAICAALRIPEVWRFDGKKIRVHLLQPDGTYQEGEKSRCFPQIPVHEVVRFLNRVTTPDCLSAVQEFRAWVRQLLGKPPIS